eukprot:CAMPEP_0179276128 /NCGR_PEP_ID=MMETSP0797-20121207/34416_1 /TAXON_ID=47934 /ORGANISM="Dinophysis acuminata, Strain DAEP01" /LENGTH=147 /DNA_ID=CAMNT_0020984671 /DNA_START=49 /DNA_END=488 /DNA_ORIENTATION=+
MGAALPDSLREALRTLGSQPWESQESCYGVLLKLLGNVADSPGEPKFRRVRKGNAAIQAKVLDCPGGAAVLLAAGFQDEPDSYVLPPEVPEDTVRAVAEAVRGHGDARRQDHLRALRDEKIAKARAEEAELNKIGGFARGRHKLSAG